VRPLRLDLENFLSYRDRTIVDLEGISAAAIVGENGAGKTSLVEAVGWALYGKGRFRSPDDYVSVGAMQARVTLTFEMADRDYRVERLRKTGASAKSDLRFDVHVLHPEAVGVGEPGGWIPVAGATIAEVQAAIVDVVGLDYETWEATSYIAQGRADAFTQLTPAGRKQLLGEVLELGRFEALADAAKDRRSSESARADELARRVMQLTEMAADRTGAETAAGEARARTERLESRAAAFELELEGERRLVEEARAKGAGAAGIREGLQNLIGRKDAAQRQATERLETSRARGDSLRARMEGQLTAIAQLRGSVELTPALQAELRELHAAIEQTERASAATRTKLEQTRASHERAVLAAEQTARLSNEASDRIDHLSRGDHSSCFTCGQGLAPELRDEIVKTLVSSGESHRDQAREHRETAAALETELRDLAQQERAAEASARHGRERAVEVEKALQRARADKEREEIERARQAELTEETSAWEQEVDRLSAELTEVAGDYEAEELRLNAELERAATAERSVSAAEGREADARQRLQLARGEHQRAVAELGAAEQLLTSLVSSTAELEDLNADLTRSTEQLRLWDLLVRMFGRDGLPALVIENAVPEIEEAANRWLAKLAAGRLSVRIESLRANKGGGIRETLDVIVTDGDDERQLEGFSGGERQRVNLALRLALSELLASRAGHRIQTLVLDEAFTALDAEGRQLAIEVIHALEDTFDLTLFVTHLGDMGEAFPQRLEITRDETSRVEVVPA
jgi:DNA repair protein SbcC/Rad50